MANVLREKCLQNNDSEKISGQTGKNVGCLLSMELIWFKYKK